jgi:hypothetical protein
LPALGGCFVEIGKRDIHGESCCGSFRSGATSRSTASTYVCCRMAIPRLPALPTPPRHTVYSSARSAASLSRRLFGRISGQFCSM